MQDWNSKELTGAYYKWWSMWFNAIIRAKPYQPLNTNNTTSVVTNKSANALLKALLFTGVARLPSVRVVRLLVNSFNERNSFFKFFTLKYS